MEIIIPVVGGLYFLILLILLFSNKSFNFKMTQLTYSGDNNFKSEENIKNNISKILFLYHTHFFSLLY